MRRWENVWKHLNDGTRKDSDLPSTQFQAAIVSAPGFAAAWELVKVQSGGDFIKHVDKLIALHTATTSNTAPEKKVLTPILGDTRRLPSQSLRRKRKQR